MKPGDTVILRNAKVNLFWGHMRLAVDWRGCIQLTEPASFEVREDNNLSEDKYDESSGRCRWRVILASEVNLPNFVGFQFLVGPLNNRLLFMFLHDTVCLFSLKIAVVNAKIYISGRFLKLIMLVLMMQPKVLLNISHIKLHTVLFEKITKGLFESLLVFPCFWFLKTAKVKSKTAFICFSFFRVFGF
jgi:hypothetical protein